MRRINLQEQEGVSKLAAMKKAGWLDSVLLFFLTTALIWPLFGLKYLNNWSSIESTFIADGRMLAARLPHPGWQPLWYCGTRFDYIYPPALRYGTALITRFGHVTAARAYHLYTALFYVIGIVAVYWMVRVGSGSRRMAWLASAGTALFSPTFLLLPVIRYDSPLWVPQRLHVLMSYGEGPHISSLCVLPAALALSFLAVRSGRLLPLAGSSILCALTVAINFYGATALAIFFPILAWSVWVGRPERAIWFRAAGIIALAYALSAFWLTPSYLRVTADNLRQVATPGEAGPRLLAVAAIIVFCIATWRWGNRRPGCEWTIFVAGASVFLSIYVLGFYYFGFIIVGNSARLIPELDLALLLAAAGAVQFFWIRPRLRILAILIPLMAAYPVVRYLRHAYTPFPKGDYEHQYEYLISKWVHENLPNQRVLPSGSVRFWYDAWFDLSQADGGSTQGDANPVLPTPAYQIPAGDRGDTAILWLQAIGTDAVIVPDRTSPESYHDYVKPEKFRGLARVLYDDQHGTVIYRVPRIHPGIGRVVKTSKLEGIGSVAQGDMVALARYVAAVEEPGQSLTQVNWTSFDRAELRVQVSAGQSILFQETYDPFWRAYENGQPVPIRRDPVMDFMLLDVPEGDHVIRLNFETPTENRIGRIVSLAAFAMLSVLLAVKFTRRSLNAPSAS